jgi:hypothetical protein
MSELKKLVGGKIAEPRKLEGLRLPSEDDQFDLAILSHVVEHVEHPRRLEDGHDGAHQLLQPGHDPAADADVGVAGAEGASDDHLAGDVRVHEGQAWAAGVSAEEGAAVGWAPGLAQTLFTYHGAVLCERAEKLSLGLEG